MSVETHRVLIGACGWNHQAWLNDFYSEDLPEDWLLGYYSNEFPVVYVPAADWLNTVDTSEWTEDVSDSFRFIFEIPDNVLDNEQQFLSALEKVKTLDDFCLGLVLKLSPSICSDTNLFEKRLNAAQSVVPVCIDAKGIELTEKLNNILSKENISKVWHGESEEMGSFQCGSLAITQILSGELDMASLRKAVEHCLSASSEDCTSVLCLDGNPPSLELLRNADIILNLL